MPLSQTVYARIAIEQLPLKASSETAETKLAAAVIKLAVEDVKRGTPAARLWFELPGTGLAFWCDVLGIDAESVRSHALGVAMTSKAGIDQQ